MMREINWTEELIICYQRTLSHFFKNGWNTTQLLQSKDEEKWKPRQGYSDVAKTFKKAIP